MTQVTQAIHIRFKGNSYDTNLEELGIRGTPSDSDLKNAIARHLDVAPAEVNDLVVERTAEGGLIVRPQASFG